MYSVLSIFIFGFLLSLCAVSIKLKQFKYKYYIMNYVDNRDWPEYNAQLVRRGEFYLDLSCVKNWSWEFKRNE